MQTLKLGSRGEDVKILQRMLHLIDDGIFGKLTEEAVKQFQSEQFLCADGIVGEKTWAKLLPMKKSKRNIKLIVVHCTATKVSQNWSVDAVRRMHKQQGWSDIGYHYYITKDGKVHNGRDVDLIGSHVAGHNSYSIGVCYEGGIAEDGSPKDTRTMAQKESLVKTLKALRILYPKAKICGHRDFANKACPSFNATSEYSRI